MTESFMRRRASAHTAAVFSRTVCIRMCVDMHADMYIDICIDICIAMAIGMCVDTWRDVLYKTCE